MFSLVSPNDLAFNAVGLALVRRGSDIVAEDPKLCLYYRNRLTILDRPQRSRPLGTGGGA